MRPFSLKLSVYALLGVLLLGLLTDRGPLLAQGGGNSISALKQERSKLKKQLELNNRLLKETKKVKQESFNALKLLERQIELQERVIANLNQEVREISAEIEEIGALISSLEFDLRRLRESYAQAAQATYQNQNTMSVMLWLMSAESFQQAFNRLIYFRMFSNFRSQQVRLIENTQQRLHDRKELYQQRKREKERLRRKRLAEKRDLDETRREKNKMVRLLRRKESRYKRRLNRTQRSLGKLKDEIQRLIELERKRKLSKAERDRIFKLSKSFYKNRNRLPWPLPMPKGVITGHFGKQKDPSGGYVKNEGIYISTVRDQSVRSVFSGEVTLVNTIPSLGRVVIVRHGNYRSVYANLNKVNVSKGDKVETLQNIGSVKTNLSNGETQLYFQIYKDFSPVDPEKWIADKR